MEEAERKQQLLILGRFGAAGKLWFCHQLVKTGHVGLEALGTMKYREGMISACSALPLAPPCAAVEVLAAGPWLKGWVEAEI